MEYDLEYLARTHGFNIREIEKVCRIFDILEDISNVKFLGERLSLYGGTALNFIWTSTTDTEMQKTGERLEMRSMSESSKYCT